MRPARRCASDSSVFRSLSYWRRATAQHQEEKRHAERIDIMTPHPGTASGRARHRRVDAFEQRRLRMARAGQPGRCVLRRAGLREHDIEYVRAKMRREQSRALVDDLAEKRLLAIQTLRHPDILRTLAREQEHH